MHFQLFSPKQRISLTKFKILIIKKLFFYTSVCNTLSLPGNKQKDKQTTTTTTKRRKTKKTEKKVCCHSYHNCANKTISLQKFDAICNPSFVFNTVLLTPLNRI